MIQLPSFKAVLSVLIPLFMAGSVLAQTPSVTICVDGAINYREFNTGGNEQSIGWLWTFESGDPAVSIEREPSVTYRSPGLFKATCQLGY
jgi:hypothetical protein